MTPFSGRVALSSLRGLVDAAKFTQGTPARVITPIATLWSKIGGARDRQLLLGDALTVIEHHAGHAFVQATKDGYCGWINADDLGPPDQPTHWISAPLSHGYSAPKVQAGERMALPMNARLCVRDITNGFAQTEYGFIPQQHLTALGSHPGDPVSIAERFLNAPYLWGGNSWQGIDCSGLVQMAFHACARPCPGDSDMQQSIGQDISGQELRRGDLLFWKGHVAMVVDADQIIHANGHSMNVAYENTQQAITRIAAAGGGPVTAKRRP